MRISLRIIVLLTVQTFGLQTGLGRSFYIDPAKLKKGAPATEQAPVASLGELSGKLSPGDVVYLAGGTYRESVTLSGIDAPNPIKEVKRHWFGPYRGRDNSNAKYVCDYSLFDNVKRPAGRRPLMPSDHKPPIDNGWWGAHNLQGAPKFANPAKGDYRLQPDSPARGAGRTLGNCTRDIDGRPRLAGKGDLGAFQSSD